jgi:hydrogenase maturation protease
VTDPSPARTLVIGVGNAWRSDDGAGIAVAERLRPHAGRFDVLEQSGEGTSLMASWEGASSVIVIDAARSGSAPGTVHRFDAAAGRIPSDFLHYSTHAFGVAEAIEMARALGILPERLILFGIEGMRFEAGTGLTPPIADAVDRVVEEIVAQVDVGASRPAPSDPASRI